MWHGATSTHRLATMIAVCLLALLVSACSLGASSGPVGHAISLPASPKATGTPLPSLVGPMTAARRREQIRQSAEWYLAHMSLDEKLGQMMLIETLWQGYNQDVDNMVAGMHAGAMIVYLQNMANPQQLRDYLATIQAHAAIPLMVTMDEEGGGVDRLGDKGFYPTQSAASDVAASGKPAEAWQEGATLAHEMLAMGINVDLAPVADVRTVPNPAELWTRFYGTTPDVVEQYAGAFLQGLQQNGVPGTLKHWPGIGSTTQDPHLTLPTIDHSKAELQATDFAPFKALLADDPAMITVTHVMVPAYDQSLPATFSSTLVDGVLRGQLGYDGVVLTDTLYMGGIKDFLHDNNLYTELPKAAVLAIQAGDDLLEGAFDTDSMRLMIEGIKAALHDGRISQSRIDTSVRRILTLKVQYGMLPLLPSRNTPGDLASAAPSSVAASIADADVPGTEAA